jgi:hypothetical protein
MRSSKAAQAKYRASHRLVRRAHSITWHAIESGRLRPQPCEVCGRADAHAHHDDYLKPLDVRWLCSKHHAEWHRKNRALHGTDPANPISPAESARNRITNIYVEHAGERLILSDWAKRLGITRRAMTERVRNWGPELAVAVPRGGTSGVPRKAGQTHCKRGHALSGENLYLLRNTRFCRECSRARVRAYRRKLAALAQKAGGE